MMNMYDVQADVGSIVLLEPYTCKECTEKFFSRQIFAFACSTKGAHSDDITFYIFSHATLFILRFCFYMLTCTCCNRSISLRRILRCCFPWQQLGMVFCFQVVHFKSYRRIWWKFWGLPPTFGFVTYLNISTGCYAYAWPNASDNEVFVQMAWINEDYFYADIYK